MIDYGRGINLVPISECNLDLIRSWRNDVRIFNWTRQDGLLNKEPHEAWFKKIQFDPSIIMFGIVAPEEGGIIGVNGLTGVDFKNRRAEFSTYISPKFQKLGYGKKSLQTLLDFGFYDLGLRSIHGETFRLNPAYGMFKKIGFKDEGIRRQFYYKNGSFTDAFLVSILDDEWREITNGPNKKI